MSGVYAPTVLTTAEMKINLLYRVKYGAFAYKQGFASIARFDLVVLRTKQKKLYSAINWFMRSEHQTRKSRSSWRKKKKKKRVWENICSSIQAPWGGSRFWFLCNVCVPQEISTFTDFSEKLCLHQMQDSNLCEPTHIFNSKARRNYPMSAHTSLVCFSDHINTSWYQQQSWEMCFFPV